MFAKAVSFFKNSLSVFSAQEKRFIFAVMASGFFISLEYGITRPVCTSLFIDHYGPTGIAKAWYATVPINLAIVFLYNRFLPRLGCLKVFIAVAISAIAINTATAFFGPLSFFQFMWKDIYILLVFKQLWSLIHSTIDTKKAKYLYGIIFGMGGIGSMVGGLVPGLLAVHIGSQKLMLLTLPLYTILSALFYRAYNNSRFDGNKETFKTDLNAKSSFFDFRSSKFVLFILLLVFFMQISTALLELQFNFFLAEKYPILDYRTQFSGRFTSLSYFVTTFCQFLGGYLVVRFLALKKAHLVVPAILAVNSLAFLAFPSFAMATYLFTAIKTLDFSIFGIVREMLYIPLKVDEKYRAKAVIDVFVYRSAKAFAPLFILIFQFFFKSYSFYQMISVLSICLAFGWMATVFYMFKHYEKLVPSIAKAS